MKSKQFYVYILANKRRTVYYIGVTNNLALRFEQHSQKITGGFSARYNVNDLLYFEVYTSPDAAIMREKELKGWRREKKIKLIQTTNLNMEDLRDSL